MPVSPGVALKEKGHIPYLSLTVFVHQSRSRSKQSGDNQSTICPGTVTNLPLWRSFAAAPFDNCGGDELHLCLCASRPPSEYGTIRCQLIGRSRSPYSNADSAVPPRAGEPSPVRLASHASLCALAALLRDQPVDPLRIDQPSFSSQQHR